MPGECDQQGKRGVEDGGLNLTPPGRQAGLTRSHPTPPNPPQTPPPELRSALQGCLRSLSVQGVNQPITRLQMPAVKETSQAPGKGPINKTQAPFGLFLYTEKLLVSISFLSFFFFFNVGRFCKAPSLLCDRKGRHIISKRFAKPRMDFLRVSTNVCFKYITLVNFF